MPFVRLWFDVVFHARVWTTVFYVLSRGSRERNLRDRRRPEGEEPKMPDVPVPMENNPQATRQRMRCIPPDAVGWAEHERWVGS